jgi:cytochrome c oxidase subunit 1
VAEGNVWNSRSPEWQVPSPMPVHNYDRPFEVVGEPYDYGLPGSVYVRFALDGPESEPAIKDEKVTK